MNFFSKEKSSEQTDRYLKPLSRNIDLENTEYEKYLRQAMEPQKGEIVRNIAIAGKYGSGKSSVIDSYFSKNYKDDYLRVSFATFKGQTQKNKTEENDRGKSNPNFDENEIYLNIINQVIYQVDPHRIPLTGFKSKKPLTRGRKSLLIITAILVLSWVFNFPHYSGRMASFDNIRNVGAIVGVIWVAWITLSSVSISNLVMKFRGISTDIQLGNDDFFEKYGDEIVYLFRQSGKRILIIEDLDRFEDIRVFEKLRELNTKLNVNNKENWKFIYLIKDDIFLDPSDRVKFFDLMIPIVPFMTAANSYEKIREMFGDKQVDDNLLFSLSLFITDYRLLTNIFNEYTIFKSSTKTTKYNELLAMVAYKNLFPAEFDGVQNGTGRLADIFKSFRAQAEKKKSKLISQKKDLIRLRESMAAVNEAQIWFLYVSEHRIHTYSTINNQSSARKFIDIDNKIYLNGNWIPYSEYLEKDNEYRKIYNSVVNFKTEIKQISEEIKQIENDDIINYIPAELDTEQDRMVYMLIHQGYIRQDYLDVINRFYGEEKSRIFLQNVLSGQGELNMELEFNSIDSWWNRLPSSAFRTVQIQNFSILEYARKEDSKKYKIMINSAEKYDTQFLEGVLGNSASTGLSNQYFQDFIKYAPDYLFQVEKLSNEIISQIIYEKKYATDAGNIEYLIEYFVNNISVEERKEFINDSTQNSDFRLGVLKRGIKQINFEEINDVSYWTDALDVGVINPTTDNLNQYYEEKGLTNGLKDFLLSYEFNSNVKSLNKDLFKKMVASNDIPEGVIRQFVDVVKVGEDKFLWKDFNLGVDVGKLILLIENNLIFPTPNEFEMLREKEIRLPDNLINQEIINFLTKQEIIPLRKWIDQFLEAKTIDIQEFAGKFYRIFNESQYRKLVYRLSTQAFKFNKILDGSKGYINQKIDETDANKLLLDWLVYKEKIKTFNSNGQGKYVLK